MFIVLRRVDAAEDFVVVDINLNIVGGARQATLLNPIIQDNSFGSPIHGSVIYSITGGADAARFGLGPQDFHNTSRLVPLNFTSPPDLANPADAGQDNVYDVQLTATFVSLGFGPAIDYRLRVVADDYADSTATTGRLSTDGTPASGVINAQNDADWFRFESKGGDYLISAPSLSSYVIYDANGAQLAGSSGATPILSIASFPAGTLYLAAYSNGLVPEGTAYAITMVEGGSTIRIGTPYDAVKSGTEKADLIYGYSDDTMSGLGGGDYIYGGYGRDIIDGGAGRDYLRGANGADSILGGADDDDINGNQGADTARGGEGNDWVVGGQDADLLDGEAGNDIVYGNLGDDTAYGGSGDDWVRGGQGDDLIYGGAGSDFMSGDRGSDTIYGGDGADRFNLIAGAGVDRVMDFGSAQGDRVIIEGGLTYALSFAGGDAHITLSDGSDMVLVGVSGAAQLGTWLLAG